MASSQTVTSADTSQLTRVGDVSELEPHGQFSRWVGGHDVLVYRFQGEIKAISNICRHFGGPIGYHKMKDGVFTCLWHCYRFSAADGACLTNPKLGSREYKVSVKDGGIYVQLIESTGERK
jgi:nitrite reductase/ring-hydroxylating ferredoxin subunit